MSRRIGPLHLRIIESSQLSKLGIKHSFKDNKFIGIFCYDLVSKEIIVKLREREGQRVDLGRSLKGHLWMVDGGWWYTFP